MKSIFLLLLSPLVLFAQIPSYPQWSQSELARANTAKQAQYLSEEEKSVIFYLNLARINPPLFADTYLKDYDASERHPYIQLDYNQYNKSSYSRSLYRAMKKLKPRNPLKPNKELYELALCHAYKSGKRGYVGHNRRGCADDYMAECCSYGVPTGLDIVVELLVDYQVRSLGHRKTCLSSSYEEIGVSIQPHKRYRHNAVLDFW